MEAVIEASRDARAVKRALALRMLHTGQTPEEVAQPMLVTLTTIYNWRDRWEAEGIAGLANRRKVGRPRKATAAYRQQLSQAVETDPTTYGYSFTVWTLERMRDHRLQATGIHLSSGRFAALLAELGYVYRRPKPDLAARQNAEAKAQASAILEELKKGRHKTIANFSLWTKRP